MLELRLLFQKKLIRGLDISSPVLSSSGELSFTINANANKAVSSFYVDSDGNLNAVEKEATYLIPVDKVELINGNVIVTY